MKFSCTHAARAALTFRSNSFCSESAMNASASATVGSPSEVAEELAGTDAGGAAASLARSGTVASKPTIVMPIVTTTATHEIFFLVITLPPKQFLPPLRATPQSPDRFPRGPHRNGSQNAPNAAPYPAPERRGPPARHRIGRRSFP